MTIRLPLLAAGLTFISSATTLAEDFSTGRYNVRVYRQEAFQAVFAAANPVTAGNPGIKQVVFSVDLVDELQLGEILWVTAETHAIETTQASIGEVAVGGALYIGKQPTYEYYDDPDELSSDPPQAVQITERNGENLDRIDDLSEQRLLARPPGRDDHQQVIHIDFPVIRDVGGAHGRFRRRALAPTLDHPQQIEDIRRAVLIGIGDAVAG
jgi:hypothetical protein